MCIYIYIFFFPPIWWLTIKCTQLNLKFRHHKTLHQFSMSGCFLVSSFQTPNTLSPQNCWFCVCPFPSLNPLFLSSWHPVTEDSRGLNQVGTLYLKPAQYWWSNLESAAVGCDKSGKPWWEFSEGGPPGHFVPTRDENVRVHRS